MDKAHKQTDEKLAKMERHLSKIYSRTSDELIAKADEHLKDFLAEDTKRAKWVAEGRISRRQYIEWRKKEFLKRRKMVTMFEQSAEQLAKVNQTATAYINGEIPEVYALNINATNEGISHSVSGYSFDLVDAETVRLLATDDSSLLPKKDIDIPKDIRWNTRKMNAEVLQGILQGETMGEIAKRMSKVVGMNETAAIRNARTMVTSAECRGRMEGFRKAEESGIILKKRWIATHDGRTRDWHSELNGVEADTDKPFVNSIGEIMYPGDPSAHPANVYNCRCTIAGVVKGFGKKQSIGLPNEEVKKPLVVQELASKTEQIEKQKKQKPSISAKPIKTDYTMRELEGKSRKELEKIACEVARKNASNVLGGKITEEEAVRRFNLLVGSNSTPQLRKYINKYGKGKK